jgi:hypothetical protein
VTAARKAAQSGESSMSSVVPESTIAWRRDHKILKITALMA